MQVISQYIYFFFNSSCYLPLGIDARQTVKSIKPKDVLPHPKILCDEEILSCSTNVLIMYFNEYLRGFQEMKSSAAEMPSYSYIKAHYELYASCCQATNQIDIWFVTLSFLLCWRTKRNI